MTHTNTRNDNGFVIAIVAAIKKGVHVLASIELKRGKTIALLYYFKKDYLIRSRSKFLKTSDSHSHQRPDYSSFGSVINLAQ